MSEQKEVVAGRYRIVREIARGGMGSVHEAHHLVSKKRVALKLLFAHTARDEAARQRFLREASAPAQIGHDGIVEVFDAGVDDDGTLFVAMEFLEGSTLRDRLDRGRLSPAELFSVFLRILDPLSAAHAKGIVHRDLKPENVFLVRKSNGGEELKILDFGIARDLEATQQSMTQTGTAMGTPHYMAPEQAMSARGVGTAADVWAIGAMLYEALTGVVPFDGETASAVIVHVCTAQHRPPAELLPGIPPALAALVDRCLAKNAEARPRDGAALFAELQQVGRTLGIPVPAAGQPGGQASGQAHASAPGHAQQPSQHSHAPSYATPQPSQHSHAPSYATPQPSQHSYATPQPGTYGNAPTYVAPAAGATGASHPYPSHASIPHGPAHAAPFGGANPGYPSMPGTMQAPPQASSTTRWVVLGAVGLVVIVGGVFALTSFFRSDDAVATATSPAIPAPAVPGVAPGVAPAVVPTVGPQRLTGALAAGDRTLASGEFADSYTFTYAAGQRFRARVHAEKLDPYLIVRSPSGKSRDNDDVSDQSRDAELVIEADEAGSYSVIVTSFRPGELGDYELTVETLP